jgi:hypothetical protein
MVSPTSVELNIPANLLNERWTSSEAIQPYVKLNSVELIHTYDEKYKISKSFATTQEEFERGVTEFLKGRLNGSTKIVLQFKGSDEKVRTCEANLSNLRWSE